MNAMSTLAQYKVVITLINKKGKKIIKGAS